MTKHIESVLKHAIAEAGYPTPSTALVTRVDEKRGDYATSIALSLATELNQNPRELASELARILEHQTGVSSVDVAGPGFINITMSDEWLQAASETLQSIEVFEGAPTFIIEYSSPNIAKPMHVGHLRTTILGQVLVNLYRYAGAEVVAWSHPGDWGTQFGKLIVAWNKWGDERALNSEPIDELLRVYIKFHQEVKENPTLDDEARAAFKSLQDGDAKSMSLWERFKQVSQQEFERMYQLLGVKFDVAKGESAYNDQVRQLVQKALAAGVAQESEGAIIIPLGDKLPPFLIQKSDGATLYATADLVSIAVRAKEYKPEELIYIVGNEQTLHFQQLFAAARKLHAAGVYGLEIELPKLTHVSYGFFRLASGKMSTRQGEVIRLEDVITQAIEQAEVMLQEKSPDLADAEREDLAKEIGIGAVKYTDLIHDRHTDVVFDWQKMFSLEGNSIVYLMYCNARCNSLLRDATSLTRSSDHPLTKGEGRGEGGWSPNERRLTLTLLELEDQMQKSIENYDPHHLLTHVYKVSSDFSRFYNTDPILKAPESVRERRLNLTKRVQEQLQLVFELLGIKAPEKL